MNSVSSHQHKWFPVKAVGLCACARVCAGVHASETSPCRMAAPGFPLLMIKSGVQYPGFLTPPAGDTGSPNSAPCPPNCSLSSETR